MRNEKINAIFIAELRPVKQEVAELKQEVGEIYRALYALVERLKSMEWGRPEFSSFSDPVFIPKLRKPKLEKIKQKKARR